LAEIQLFVNLEKSQNIEKIVFKIRVSQFSICTFANVNLCSQLSIYVPDYAHKLSIYVPDYDAFTHKHTMFYIYFTVEPLQNIFMEHDLNLRS